MSAAAPCTRPWWAVSIWLWVPPLAISFALWPHLGSAYQPQAAIPAWLTTTESVVRVLVIGFAALLPLRWHCKRGLAVYLLGLIAYLASQLAATDPSSAWSGSAIGFTSPAWTPLLWMAGIVMMSGRPSWDRRGRTRVLHVSLALVFGVAHTVQTAWVFALQTP